MGIDGGGIRGSNRPRNSGSCSFSKLGLKATQGNKKAGGKEGDSVLFSALLNHRSMPRSLLQAIKRSEPTPAHNKHGYGVQQGQQSRFGNRQRQQSVGDMATLHGSSI